MQMCIYDRYIFACVESWLNRAIMEPSIKYYSRKLFKNILIKIILQIIWMLNKNCRKW